VEEAATNTGCVPACGMCARTADDPARSHPHAHGGYVRARAYGASQTGARGLCWWCRRGPSSAPRCRGLPWGRAASGQDCGQLRAEGGPRPQAQRQRGSGTRLGQPSRLPAAHERRARAHAHTPPTTHEHTTPICTSKDTTTHQCPRNSVAAPITRSRHSGVAPQAHIGGPCAAPGAACRTGTAGWGARTPNGRPQGSSPAGTARPAHAPQAVHTVQCVHGALGTPRRPSAAQCGPAEAQGEGTGGCLPSQPCPAAAQATQVAARIWAHSPCGAIQGIRRRWSGRAAWAACARPLRGAPPGLQLWCLSGPVPGRRAGPKLRTRGPPRAPRMHLGSCYTAEAGGAAHHGTPLHHGPRNRQTAVSPHRANRSKPPLRE